MTLTPLAGVCTTPLLITSPGQRIQSHSGHDSHAVDDKLVRLAQAGQEDKVAQDGDEQHAGDRAADTTPSAGEAGAADNDGGDRVEVKARADVAVDVADKAAQ